MIMTKEEFIKAELNTERLTPLQWQGIMNAMDNYAEHYHGEQLLIQRVSGSLCTNFIPRDDFISRGIQKANRQRLT